MSTAENKAVFISYASQDAEAAKRICEALRAAGVEVWFDQNELVGGDAWDAKIRGQIAACALFVPLISASAITWGRVRYAYNSFRRQSSMRRSARHLRQRSEHRPCSRVTAPPPWRRGRWTRHESGGPTAHAICYGAFRSIAGDGGAGCRAAGDAPRHGAALSHL